MWLNLSPKLVMWSAQYCLTQIQIPIRSTSQEPSTENGYEISLTAFGSPYRIGENRSDFFFFKKHHLSLLKKAHGR